MEDGVPPDEVKLRVDAMFSDDVCPSNAAGMSTTAIQTASWFIPLWLQPASLTMPGPRQNNSSMDAGQIYLESTERVAEKLGEVGGLTRFSGRRVPHSFAVFANEWECHHELETAVTAILSCRTYPS